MEAKKTVRMRFKNDMFYSDPNVPIYDKDKVHDVPENMVERWLKRGGELVDETEAAETEEALDVLGDEGIDENEGKLKGDEDEKDEDKDEEKKPNQTRGNRRRRN